MKKLKSELIFYENRLGSCPCGATLLILVALPMFFLPLALLLISYTIIHTFVLLRVYIALEFRLAKLFGWLPFCLHLLRFYLLAVGLFITCLRVFDVVESTWMSVYLHHICVAIRKRRADVRMKKEDLYHFWHVIVRATWLNTIQVFVLHLSVWICDRLFLLNSWNPLFNCLLWFLTMLLVLLLYIFGGNCMNRAIDGILCCVCVCVKSIA